MIKFQENRQTTLEPYFFMEASKLLKISSLLIYMKSVYDLKE